ncbi:MAG: YdcF family protein [Alphaproteobacteria bacterium]|nr:YdcF family protein [Alphaproteobacteria bacterium]
MERPAIVVFGAAVRAGGRPSPALARRIGYAAIAGQNLPEAPILCSGGVGRAGPSEASVIAAGLLGHGLAPERLVLDEASADTLQSVVAAAAFVRARSLSGCVICSDRYHITRIRLLLGALGVASAPGPLRPGRAGASLRHWTRMRLREALATPYDLAIVLARRPALLAAISASASRRP